MAVSDKILKKYPSIRILLNDLGAMASISLSITKISNNGRITADDILKATIDCELEDTMDIGRAKEIISALAEGIDPTTGEVLPDNSICNKGEIVRAFYAVLKHLDDNKPTKKLPANAGKSWTKADEDLLVHLYRSGAPKREICNILQRSESGVAARLVHLRIIDDRDNFKNRK